MTIRHRVRYIGIVVSGAVIIASGIFVLRSLAGQTASVSLQPESGALTGNATVATDSSATGSGYIVFGSPAAPRPTVSITANPTSISAGQPTTVTWSSTNTTSCAASWTSSTASNGSQQVTPTATTTYGITCSGSGGSASASTAVTVTSPSGGGGGGSCSTIASGSGNGNFLSLQGGAYHLQPNEWSSSAPFAICTDGGVDFKITTSNISQSGGPPGAYPSLYKGCHWGFCTTNSGLPVNVGAMVSTPNKVTTTYNTTVISSGAWDDSYDIWFNPNTSTNNNSTGLEMMIWLDHMGGVQPAGKVVARGVTIGGHSYDVWHGGNSPGGTVSYVLTSPATSLTNLDLGPLAADAVNRGYLQNSWSLIDVEAGFEPWQGGVGLAANSFSVTVN